MAGGKKTASGSKPGTAPVQASAPPAAAPAAPVQAATAVARVPAQPKQNGVTRPRDDTATGRVWAIADEISAATGKPAERGPVVKQGEAEGLNNATVATQYGRWRKFHNLGRYQAGGAEVAEPASVDAAEVEEEIEVEE